MSPLAGEAPGAPRPANGLTVVVRGAGHASLRPHFVLGVGLAMVMSLLFVWNQTCGRTHPAMSATLSFMGLVGLVYVLAHHFARPRTAATWLLSGFVAFAFLRVIMWVVISLDSLRTVATLARRTEAIACATIANFIGCLLLAIQPLPSRWILAACVVYSTIRTAECALIHLRLPEFPIARIGSMINSALLPDFLAAVGGTLASRWVLQRSAFGYAAQAKTSEHLAQLQSTPSSQAEGAASAQAEGATLLLSGLSRGRLTRRLILAHAVPLAIAALAGGALGFA